MAYTLKLRLLGLDNGHLNSFVRVVIEIQKHQNNYNRKKETLRQNQIWNLIIGRILSVPLDGS